MNLEQGKYLNGKKHGEWKTYDSEGRLKKVSHYINGKKEGQTTWYWINGNISDTLTYKDNEPIGEWICYNKQGVKQHSIQLPVGNIEYSIKIKHKQ